MPHAAMKRVQEMKLAPARKIVRKILPKLVPTTNNHASELQPHKFTPPNTGNAATDKKYQQQQDKLAAKQTQDHQKLQQQQEKEHQQAATEKLQRRAKTADGAAPHSANATGRAKACHSAEADGAAPSAAPNCTKAGEPSSRGKAALIAR